MVEVKQVDWYYHEPSSSWRIRKTGIQIRGNLRDVKWRIYDGNKAVERLPDYLELSQAKVAAAQYAISKGMCAR